MAQSYSRSQRRLAVPLWYERLLALILLANYGLVIFDLAYIPLRDFWLQGRVQFTIKVGPIEQEFPQPPLRILPVAIAPYYDWVKGIEPYRSTTAYLALVEQLNRKIDEKALEGTASPNRPDPPPSAPEIGRPGQGNLDLNPPRDGVTQEAADIDDILATLRAESVAMIQENPFQIANKTGTLERIKNKMRAHVFGDQAASVTKAFQEFWSKDYLLTHGSSEQFRFFDQQIRPLIETNYFRVIGENGQPMDNFPLIDFPFFVIFLTDFMVRTRLISRRYKGISWVDAMFWRWYDFFLFIPAFRWLRIIPLMTRLDQAKLLNLNTVKGQAVQGFVAIIAEDMTEVIVVRIIDQLQDQIHQGQIRKLLDSTKTTEYIDINNRNEIVEIVRVFSQVLIDKVLPKLQPEVQKLVLYNVDLSLKQTTAYQQLQNLPGIKAMQTQMIAGLIDKTYKQMLIILQGMLKSDPEFDRLLENTLNKLSQDLKDELQQQNNLDNVEELLIDFFEEFKINYIQKLSSADIERILDQVQ
ncbi:MAG: hypothetical protein RLZZ568_2134 [Cyanobacteriota bacterium]